MIKKLSKFFITILFILMSFSCVNAQDFSGRPSYLNTVSTFYLESVSDIVSSIESDLNRTLTFYKPLFSNIVAVYKISINNIFHSVKISLKYASNVGSFYTSGFSLS